MIKELRAEIVTLRARVAELEYRLGADSSNSSRPPSSDPPWKKPAKPRSSRGRSGRKPGKQPGDPGVSRSLCDTPGQVVVIAPDRCRGCALSLAGAVSTVRDRRQVVDLPPVPAPFVTEYQLVTVTCRCCGVVTTRVHKTGHTPIRYPTANYQLTVGERLVLQRIIARVGQVTRTNRVNVC